MFQFGQSVTSIQTIVLAAKKNAFRSEVVAEFVYFLGLFDPFAKHIYRTSKIVLFPLLSSVLLIECELSVSAGTSQR